MIPKVYKIKNIDITYHHNIDGRVVIPKDYDKSKHLTELNVAILLKNKLGGIIELLIESNVEGEKTADYLWNNHLWELKNITTKNSIDWQVRKAIKQIWNNPGGIILNVRDCTLEEDEILDIACNRINRVSDKMNKITIILIDNDEIIRVLHLIK